MIDKRDGVHITCDGCDAETEVYEAEDFLEMIADAKAAGWDIHLDGDTYVHNCGSCATQARINRQRDKFR